MATNKLQQNEPTIVKKYANRRLYDTGRSSYVTLDDLCEMVKEDYNFVVYDAKSGKDLTRHVLMQIVVDQEAKGNNLLSIPFLKKLIGFYGDHAATLIPDHLDEAITSFKQGQEAMHDQINRAEENTAISLQKEQKDLNEYRD